VIAIILELLVNNVVRVKMMMVPTRMALMMTKKVLHGWPANAVVRVKMLMVPARMVVLVNTVVRVKIPMMTQKVTDVMMVG
jgi:hypothetical protein